MQVSLSQTKARLAELIAAAERGEEVIIARRGVPVARLVPIVGRRSIHLGLLEGVVGSDSIPDFLDQDEDHATSSLTDTKQASTPAAKTQAPVTRIGSMVALRNAVPIDRVVELLGGETALQANVRNPMEAHAVLLRGLPADPLLCLISVMPCLAHGDALRQVVGLSPGALRRHHSSRRFLSLEQGNRTWRLARVLALAMDVARSEEAAAALLNTSAIGLSGWKPLDLLTTPIGARIAEDYLRQMDDSAPA